MKVKNSKLLDGIGAACGVFLVLVLLGNIVNGAMTAKAEADALKATGIGTVLTAAESSPLKVETAKPTASTKLVARCDSFGVPPIAFRSTMWPTTR